MKEIKFLPCSLSPIFLQHLKLMEDMRKEIELACVIPKHLIGKEETKVTEKLSMEFFAAGVKFRKGWKENLEALEEGQELFLVPEPTNKFDKYAIKIMSPAGVQLGYVPAKTGEALILSQAITSGKIFKATATELAIDFEPWRALQVLVEEVE